MWDERADETDSVELLVGKNETDSDTCEVQKDQIRATRSPFEHSGPAAR